MILLKTTTDVLKQKSKRTLSVPYDEAKRVLGIVDIVANLRYATILVNTTNIDA